jgi:Putative prokaryotic signal transducing protein
MSDHLVTVASYASALEAQMAKNLLEAEGIPAFLAGEMTAEALSGISSEAHLQVRDRDARRAASILASVAAEAALDDDWETQAESGAGVWACSLCGTPVSNRLTVCPDCQTPNHRIKTERRKPAPSPPSRPTSEAVQAGEQIKAAPPPRPRQDGEAPEPVASPHPWGCATLLALVALPALWLWWR